jgi:hypothetical protein
MLTVHNINIDLQSVPLEELPPEVTSAVGARLLSALNHWAYALGVKEVEFSNDDMSQAACMLVSCSGRATTEERACALLGWLVVTCENLGVTRRELMAMLSDVLALRAVATLEKGGG